MDAARLQQLIYKGYGKAAAHVGPLHSIYRPTSMVNPIQPANLIGTLNASFNINGSYTGQSKSNQLYWQVLADARQLQIGDYLVGTDTYCVIAMDSILPPIALRCTQRLTFSRPLVNENPGVQPYPDPEVDTAYAVNIPACVNVKKETGRPDPGLPMDNSLRAFYGAFFYLPDGAVRTRDQATDENGDNYQLVAAQSGLFGYEALLELVEA